MKQFFFKATAAFAILSSAVFAQQSAQTLTGTFVFSEEGTGGTQPIASIALLTFTNGGMVSGTELTHSPGSTLQSSLQGSFTLNNDGTGAVSLLATTMPTDGSDPVSFMVNYQLIAQKSGTITALRTDNGFFTIGHLSKAAPAGLPKGAFAFAEHGNGAAFAGLGIVTLDGANALTGTERVEALGSSLVSALTGSYAIGANGFGTMAIMSPATDVFGNITSTPMNYAFVVGADQIFAIRTDNNAAALATLSSLDAPTTVAANQ